jgi:predicted MFS family arabinose efflux permease
MSGWSAVALIAVGTLLHGTTQVVSAILLPNGAPTGRAATMTLRGAASSFGSATGAALGGVLLETAGYATVGVSTVAFCALAAGVAWWGGMRSQRPAPRVVAAPLAQEAGLPKAA